MSLLERFDVLQSSLYSRLPELRAPAGLHPMHVTPESFAQARAETQSLLATIRHTSVMFADAPISSRAIAVLRKWAEDQPSRPVPTELLPKPSKRRRYAAVPAGSDQIAALEHVVSVVGGMESFRGEEGVLTVGGKAFVLDVEPAKRVARLTYGAQSKEAPWLVERLVDDMSPASFGCKLEALARLDTLAAEMGEGRDVFEEMKTLMDRLSALSEARRRDCTDDPKSLLGVGSPGLVVTPGEPPWLSLVYDVPLGVDLRDEWRQAVHRGFDASSSASLLTGSYRLNIEPAPGLSTRFRATLDPPLVISPSSGHALASLFVQQPGDRQPLVVPPRSADLRETDIEAVLCPSLLFDAQSAFEFNADGLPRPLTFTLGEPSSLTGLRLDHFDFATTQELEGAVQVLSRQQRLNTLFTSCFGPRTRVSKADDPFAPAPSTDAAPNLTSLLNGTWQTSRTVAHVSLDSESLHLSLPSQHGYEIRVDVSADYDVTVDGIEAADRALLRRILDLSRGNVPLLLVKALG